MIRIYGDSHALNSFKNLQLDHTNYGQAAVTMFRIGRDNIIINFNKDEIQNGDIIVLSYGEVDARNHVKKQINKGVDEDEVICELINNYFVTIKNNTNDKNVKIIIVGIVPAMKKNEYEKVHGVVRHDFGFEGTDEERVKYTDKMNNLLEKKANERNYTYFDPYSYYKDSDGCLKIDLSDGVCHIGDNSFFLERFCDLYTKINVKK